MSRIMYLVSHSIIGLIKDELAKTVIEALENPVPRNQTYRIASDQKSFKDHRAIQINIGCDYDYYVIALLTQFTDQVLDSFPFDKTMYGIWDSTPKEKIIVLIKRDVWCDGYKQWIDSRNIIFGEGAEFIFF